jgi:hypothetical protein
MHVHNYDYFLTERMIITRLFKKDIGIFILFG